MKERRQINLLCKVKGIQTVFNFFLFHQRTFRMKWKKKDFYLHSKLLVHVWDVNVCAVLTSSAKHFILTRDLNLNASNPLSTLGSTFYTYFFFSRRRVHKSFTAKAFCLLTFWFKYFTILHSASVNSFAFFFMFVYTTFRLILEWSFIIFFSAVFISVILEWKRKKIATRWENAQIAILVD